MAPEQFNNEKAPISLHASEVDAFMRWLACTVSGECRYRWERATAVVLVFWYQRTTWRSRPCTCSSMDEPPSSDFPKLDRCSRFGGDTRRPSRTVRWSAAWQLVQTRG